MIGYEEMLRAMQCHKLISELWWVQSSFLVVRYVLTLSNSASRNCSICKHHGTDFTLQFVTPFFGLVPHVPSRWLTFENIGPLLGTTRPRYKGTPTRQTESRVRSYGNDCSPVPASPPGASVDDVRTRWPSPELYQVGACSIYLATPIRQR